MNNVKCRYCGQEVRVGSRHQCSQMRQAHVSERTVSDDDDGFFISLAIAVATDDWMLGALVGGNLAGAMIGDALSGDDDDSRRSGSSDHHDSDPSDTGSYDSGGDSSGD